VFAAVVGMAAACDRPLPTTDDILSEWTLAPSAPAVDQPALARITLVDRTNGMPVRGAALRVEGHMSHPGMVPVIEAATEQNAGEYAARIALTMGGEWTLIVSGTLADGRSIRRDVARITTRPAN